MVLALEIGTAAGAGDEPRPGDVVAGPVIGLESENPAVLDRRHEQAAAAAVVRRAAGPDPQSTLPRGAILPPGPL
jgi:hypothetical protein